jgi:hypothetical protein
MTGEQRSPDGFEWEDVVEPRPLGDPLSGAPADGQVPADLSEPLA